MTSKTRVAVLSIVLAGLLAVAGCGGSGSAGSGKATEPTKVEKKSDGSVVLKAPSGGATATVDPDSGEVTVQTDQGAITAGKKLPDGFPKDEIPIVDGSVVGGSKGEAGGPYAYTVLVQVDGSSPGDVVNAITKQLRTAGFKATPGMTMDQMSTSTYTTAKYAVGVNAVKGGGSTITVTYVVKKT